MWFIWSNQREMYNCTSKRDFDKPIIFPFAPNVQIVSKILYWLNHPSDTDWRSRSHTPTKTQKFLFACRMYFIQACVDSDLTLTEEPGKCTTYLTWKYFFHCRICSTEAYFMAHWGLKQIPISRPKHVLQYSWDPNERYWLICLFDA